MLKLARAVDRGQYSTLLVGGGVTANSLLRTRVRTFADERGLALRLPAIEYCLDNAAMIAGLGFELLLAGRRDDLTLTATPTTAC